LFSICEAILLLCCQHFLIENLISANIVSLSATSFRIRSLRRCRDVRNRASRLHSVRTSTLTRRPTTASWSQTFTSTRDSLCRQLPKTCVASSARTIDSNVKMLFHKFVTVLVIVFAQNVFHRFVTVLVIVFAQNVYQLDVLKPCM